MSKVNHLPIETLSEATRAHFPTAKLLIAIDWDETDRTKPKVIQTYVGDPAKKLVRASQMGTGVYNTDQLDPRDRVLLPKDDEVLQITAPDGAVRICFTKPFWSWVGVQITEI